MRVLDVHERDIGGDGASVLEQLEQLWPARWPALTDAGVGFLRHEPVEAGPGRRLFRITAPRGLDAVHGWEADGSVLRHRVEGEARGAMRLAWPLVVRPIHDALHEDILDAAQGREPQPLPLRVRALRRALRRFA